MDSSIIYITCQRHKSHKYIRFFCYIKFSSTDKKKFSIYNLLYNPVEKSTNVFNGEKFIVTVTAIKLNLKEPIELNDKDKAEINMWVDEKILERVQYDHTLIADYSNCDDFKDLIIEIVNDQNNIDKYTDSVYEITKIKRPEIGKRNYNSYYVYMKFEKDYVNDTTNCTIYNYLGTAPDKPPSAFSQTRRLLFDNKQFYIYKLKIKTTVESFNEYQANLIETEREEAIQREKDREMRERAMEEAKRKKLEEFRINLPGQIEESNNARADREALRAAYDAGRQSRQIQGGGKKKGKAVVVKKVILGKERCIYKILGSKKEHVKYKGTLVTVTDYKNIMKSKPNAKAKSKAKVKAKSKAKAKAKAKP